MPSSIMVDMSGFEVLGSLTRKIPYATSKGINKSLGDAKNAIVKQIPKKLDRPKTFSAKGAIAQTYTKKTERPQAASVFIKDIQAAYLIWQIEGGTQTKDINPISPVNIKLGKKHGNIPSLKGGKVFKRKKHFVATIKKTTGLWLRLKRTKSKKIRPGGGVKLVLVMRENKPYKKGRLPFYKIAEGVLKTRLPQRINNEIQHVIQHTRRSRPAIMRAP